MRAITVRQPWAWAIIHGGKDVENRSRNIAGSYRGPVAIHAGLRDDDAVLDYENPMAGLIFGSCQGALEDDHNRHHCDWCQRTEPQRFAHRGHIIGVVNLVGAHESRLDGCGVGKGTARLGELIPLCSEWAMPWDYHLVLANPRALHEPIPCRGRLGLWAVPDDIAARIEAAS